VREINVSLAGDPVHAGDKALMRETPGKQQIKAKKNNMCVYGHPTDPNFC
jgi:hypothetical protein